MIFGKTNLPTFAMDWQTYNPIFGTTNNPWDLSCTLAGPPVVRPPPSRLA